VPLEPQHVITVRSDRTVDDLLRRSVEQVEASGLDVLMVLDVSGEAYDIGVVMPDTKLVLFGGPNLAARMIVDHPHLALDLPLKLCITQREGGGASVISLAPECLAQRHALTHDEVHALRVVDTIARAIGSRE
jgi:uncharacterized protein (DUF302 family)